MLIVHLENTFAQVAVIVRGQAVYLSRKNKYSGRELLRDAGALAQVLYAVKQDALSQGIAPDSAVFAIPAGVGFETLQNLETVCAFLGIRKHRCITTSAAEAIALTKRMAGTGGLSEGRYCLLTEICGRVEYVLFDPAADMLEIEENDLYRHSLPFRSLSEAMTGPVSGILLAGSIPHEIRKAASDYAADKKIPAWEAVPAPVLTGVAAYARILTGDETEMLVLDICGCSVGARIQGDEFLPLVTQNTTVPTYGKVSIRPEELPNHQLQLRVGTIHRGFCNLTIPLTAFENNRELTVQLDLNADRRPILTVSNDLGRKQSWDLWQVRPESEPETNTADPDLKSLLKQIELLDDLLRSIAYVEKRGDAGMLEGLRLIETKMERMLEEVGVVPIKAVGCRFTPELHNAVEHFNDPTLGENLVVYEYKRGYLKDGRVLRCSDVVVAN